LVLGALAPWALLRLLPLSELASGAAASLRGELLTAGGRSGGRAWGAGLAGHEWEATTTEMRRQAEDVAGAGLDSGAAAPLERAPETLVGAASAPAERDTRSSADGDLQAEGPSGSPATGVAGTP